MPDNNDEIGSIIYKHFAEKNFENSRRFHYDYSPQNLRQALAEIGSPQNSFRSIHIAGTVGKGSSAIYFKRLLMRHFNERVGLYMSPHYLYIGERMQINFTPIAENRLKKLWRKFQPICDFYKLSYFDTLTLLAFCYFADENISWAVIETGLGGRLDSTNVIQPQLTLLCEIHFDHTSILGNTLEKIAIEKAGIIKKQTPCYYVGENVQALRVFQNTAQQREAPFWHIESNEKKTYLHKNYDKVRQVFTHFFQDSSLLDTEIEDADVSIAGRLEIIPYQQRKILYDSAHNYCGISATVASLPYLSEKMALQSVNSRPVSEKPWHLCVNFLREKNLRKLFLRYIYSFQKHKLRLKKITLWSFGDLRFFQREDYLKFEKTFRQMSLKYNVEIQCCEENPGKIIAEDPQSLFLFSGSIYLYQNFIQEIKI